MGFVGNFDKLARNLCVFQLIQLAYIFLRVLLGFYLFVGCF
jgi:hypothetical protein